MTRTRLSVSLAFFTTLVLGVACTKKSSTESENGDEKPSPPMTGGESEADAKAEAQKRLKQIGLAMHNFESGMQALPLGVVGPKGNLGLSWRVAILPYFPGDEAALYRQFKLEEPWDSDHNKKMIAKMPKVYESPGKKAPEGKTHLRSFAGDFAIMRFPPARVGPDGKPAGPFAHLQPGFAVPGRSMVHITDGSSNTMMVAEAAEPIEWTRPEDLPYPGFPGGPKPPPVPKLGGPFAGGFHALMGDGSAHFFPDTLPENVLRALITADGGEVLGKEASEILFPPKPKKAVPPSSVPAELPDAAERNTVVENYRKLVSALHEHSDAMGQLPAGIGAKNGLGLSWRVQILPMLGQKALYSEFKLSEPWDSDNNKRIIERMPKVFASPGKAAAKGHTFIRMTQGQGGIIPTGPNGKVQVRPDLAGGPAHGLRFPSGIPDGTSNTILFAEAADAVPWTKPEELPFAIPAPVTGKGGRYEPPKDAKIPALGGVFADGFHVAMADGRITFYKTGYPNGELAKLLCPNDGWVVDPLGPPDKIAYSIPMEPTHAVPGKTDVKPSSVPYKRPPK
jgi:hypothetical protein